MLVRSMSMEFLDLHAGSVTGADKQIVGKLHNFIYISVMKNLMPSNRLPPCVTKEPFQTLYS